MWDNLDDFELETLAYIPLPDGGQCESRRCVKCGGVFVIVNNFENECACGQLYNGAGQVLAPKDQWGEETGEIF